jgi:pSer/pThr/pTyr-binding forkhead associated (FHA) protein
MAQTLNLTFMSGSRDGEEISLEATGAIPSVSIGRSPPCELVIPDDIDLSRRHARIYWNGESWMLEDLNSSNGTFLGEFQGSRRLAAAIAINDGEIFRTGLTRFRFGSSNGHGASIPVASAIAKRY